MQRMFIFILAFLSFPVSAEKLPEPETPEGVTHYFLKRTIANLSRELAKDGCVLDAQSLRNDISPPMIKYVSENFNDKQIELLGQSYKILSSDKPQNERKREFDTYIDSLSVEMLQQTGGVGILNSLSHQSFYQTPMRQRMMECIQKIQKVAQ